jgi:hypothetical protein
LECSSGYCVDMINGFNNLSQTYHTRDGDQSQGDHACKDFARKPKRTESELNTFIIILKIVKMKMKFHMLMFNIVADSPC